jgi:hypothetical protein
MNTKISEPDIVKAVAVAPFLRNLDSPSEEGGEADRKAVIAVLAIASVVRGDVGEFHFFGFLSFYTSIIAECQTKSREDFPRHNFMKDKARR